MNNEYNEYNQFNNGENQNHSLSNSNADTNRTYETNDNIDTGNGMNNTNYNTQSDYYWNSNTSQNMNPQNQNPRKRKRKKPVAACVAAVMIISIGVGTVWYGRNHGFNSTSAARVGTTNTLDNTVEKSNTTPEANVEKVTVNTAESTQTTSGVVITDVSDIVDEVLPAVVAITSTSIVESSDFGPSWWYGNGDNEYTTEGAGSGIIIAQTDSELLVVTNNHVVEGATTLSVQFADGQSVDAAVKGTDSNSDLAVVAIPIENVKADTLKAIKIATLGSSDDLQVGDGVVAIGNALGYGQSVTTGVVSALDREVEAEDGSTQKYIQTDAAINGGNSGGALINSKGQVVGINAAKYSASGSSSEASIEGMGFAIPISKSTDVINNLMNQETKTKVEEAKRGYLGITGQDVSSSEAKVYGFPQGVVVASVIAGGAAENAGIEKADIITAVNGNKIVSMTELKEQLSYYAVGEKVTVTISYPEGREYKSKDVEVTLQETTENTEESTSATEETPNGRNNNNGNSNGGSDENMSDFFNFDNGGQQ